MNEVLNPTHSVERYLIGYYALNAFLTCSEILSVEANAATQTMLLLAVFTAVALCAVTLVATRKRKRWARWIIVAFVLLNCLSTAAGLLSDDYSFDDRRYRTFVIESSVVSFMGAMSTILLFVGDGMKEWFSDPNGNEHQAN